MSPHLLPARGLLSRAEPAPAAPALLSPQWFRVASLRPQLLAQVQQQRMVVRGQVWQTLVAADGRRSFRLNAAAWSAVARCDGHHTVQQAWDAAQAEHAEQAPTQAQMLQMLSQLDAAGLLSFDRTPDFGDTAAAPTAAGLFGGEDRRPSQHPAQHRQQLLSWRISLGNPDRLLARLARSGRLPGPAAWWLAAWLALMAWAAITALLHASELALDGARVLATPTSWGLAGLVYPVMKLLHEAGHGWVARRCGAPVTDWGVTWLMFVPVPYVDASAASALPLRRQRLAVSAAGLAVELSVAAAACTGALQMQAGALRDAALLLFFLAVGSSLLVNANPLLRFDGYHMLCDALSLPNLASRSSQHWSAWWRRRVQGPAAGPQPAAAPGEAPWLWLYAPAALAMRWVVAGAVVLWLGGLSQLLGQLAMALFAWQLVGAPLAQRVRGRPGLSAGPLRGMQARRLVAWAAPLVLLAAVLLWPVPVASVAQGVLWLPEEALVRTQAGGFVQEVLVQDGQSVRAGDALLQLHDPLLRAEAERLQGRVQDLQAEEERALRSDAAAAAAASHVLQAAIAEQARNQQRLQLLTVRAQATGRIALPHAADLSGRHLARGSLVAHVVTGHAGIVQLAIPQEHAGRLPSQATLVQVLAADGPSTPRDGQWLGLATGAQAQLPSAALGSRSGGRIASDPGDTRGLRPLQPVVVGEVQLAGLPATRIGQRVLVRFEQGRAPLLLQAARAGQQLVLRHFNPAT